MFFFFFCIWVNLSIFFINNIFYCTLTSINWRLFFFSFSICWKTKKIQVPHELRQKLMLIFSLGSGCLESCLTWFKWNHNKPIGPLFITSSAPTKLIQAVPASSMPTRSKSTTSRELNRSKFHTSASNSTILVPIKSTQSSTSNP